MRVKEDEALLPDVQGQPDPFAVVRVGIQPGQLSAAAGAAQKYSAVVVDDTSGEVGKDRGEGDSPLEVRDLPTGGGRRAATPVCSDFGADRTACDATRAVPIWLRSPVWAEVRSGSWRERGGMHGIRAANDARTNSTEGASDVRKPCETRFSAGKSAYLLEFHAAFC